MLLKKESRSQLTDCGLHPINWNTVGQLCNCGAQIPVAGNNAIPLGSFHKEDQAEFAKPRQVEYLSGMRKRKSSHLKPVLACDGAAEHEECCSLVSIPVDDHLRTGHLSMNQE